MAKEWGAITESHKKFAQDQKIFFVASALGDEDVNLSPKGLDSLRILDERTVIYADYHGSGAQTARHLAGGGKSVITFMSFGEKPLILRFYCTGRVVSKDSQEFEKLHSAHFPQTGPEKLRQILWFDVYRVQTSCGYGVPKFEHVGDRSGEPYFDELYGA
ncbi:MAG: pyridoxamine 5'-phosphate oxidase family protein [Nitrospinae bacterium]|nr:pyridoxamine 5'-phosphate oxidase family protein [Nitrospinota bacterium]